MTITECIIDYCENSNKKLFTTREIKSCISLNYNKNSGSVIPMDLCYNRTNEGIANLPQNTIFEYLGNAQFLYLGLHYPFSGFVYHKPKHSKNEYCVGEYQNGILNYFESESNINSRSTSSVIGQYNSDRVSVPEYADKSETIEQLFIEYNRILAIELFTLGSKPTECRALLGRLGEFRAAIELNGKLPINTNQPGWDIIYNSNRRVSVKTTAQRIGFVSFNIKTLSEVDEVRIYQFGEKGLNLILHCDKEVLLKEPSIRYYPQNNPKSIELDIKKAKKIFHELHSD